MHNQVAHFRMLICIFSLGNFRGISKAFLKPVFGPDHFATATLLQQFIKIGQLTVTSLNKSHNSTTEYNPIVAKVEGKGSSSTLL